MVGQTTRRDVLLGLGDPDGKAPDERWFTYGSAIGLGGVGALFAFDSPGYTGRESVEYRRLIVRFDGNGVVSSVEWQKKRCAEYPLGGLVDSGTVTTVPCVDIQGNDLTSAAPDTLTGEIIAQYDNVRWRLSAAGGRPCKDQHQVALGASGLMKITRDSLILVLPATGQSERRAVVQHPAVAVTIPVSEMTSVMPPSRALRSARLVRPVNVDVEELMIVEQKNGSCLYVDLLYVEGHGQNKTKAASELLQKTIAVATAENGIPPSDPK